MGEFFTIWGALTLITVVFNDYPTMSITRLLGHKARLNGYDLTEKQEKFFSHSSVINNHLLAAFDALWLVLAFYMLRSVI